MTVLAQPRLAARDPLKGAAPEDRLSRLSGVLVADQRMRISRTDLIAQLPSVGRT
jgi:hypothetical protein